MIDMNNITIAMCPFCRSYIESTTHNSANIHSEYSTDDVAKILQNRENRIICDTCGKVFYHEHNCRIICAEKNYAIISLPRHTDSAPVTKTALYRLLKKDFFRFRIVREFIQFEEKVRIFENELDDRVIELIKYNCVPDAKGLGKGEKIILTDIDGNAMTFTRYDGYDTPLSSHKVSTDAYHTYRKGVKKEILTGTNVQWMEINLNWAEKYTKENPIL